MGRMMRNGEYVKDGIVVRVVNTGTAADGSVGILWCSGDGGVVFIPGADVFHVENASQFEVVDVSLLVGKDTDKLGTGSTVRVKSNRRHNGTIGLAWFKDGGEVLFIFPGGWCVILAPRNIEKVEGALLQLHPQFAGKFSKAA